MRLPVNYPLPVTSRTRVGVRKFGNLRPVTCALVALPALAKSSNDRRQSLDPESLDRCGPWPLLRGSRCWRDRIAGKVPTGAAPGVDRPAGVRLMLSSLAGVVVASWWCRWIWRRAGQGGAVAGKMAPGFKLSRLPASLLMPPDRPVARFLSVWLSLSSLRLQSRL